MTRYTRYTIDDIMDLEPCDDYPRERVRDLFAGRETLTLTNMLDLNIPPEDRIWVVTQLMPERDARAFARWCARKVLHLWDAPEVVRRYLETGDESLRDVVRDAALVAERDAAPSAARAAAWNAARAAARDAAPSVERAAAALAAALSAARAAVLVAERDAEWDTALSAQIEELRRITTQHEVTTQEQQGIETALEEAALLETLDALRARYAQLRTELEFVTQDLRDSEWHVRDLITQGEKLKESLTTWRVLAVVWGCAAVVFTTFVLFG